MTDKDPKDMTVSELLRKAADQDAACHSTGIDELAYLMGINDGTCYSVRFEALADKVDAELAQARELSLRRGAELWAKANGWPDFRDGEDFGAWLDRCFIPRPRFEDGEPVQFGDSPVGLDGVEKFIFTRSCGGSCQMQDADGNMLTVFPGAFAKRPDPEVLGADEKPIKVGETVWDIYGRGPAEVYRIGPSDDEDGPVVWDIEGNYTMPYLLTHEPPVLGADGKPIVKGETAYRTDRPTAEINILYIRSYDDGSSDVVYCEGDPSSTKMCDSSLITHTPPDTQQRIDGDALKSCIQYWGCNDLSCGKCPALIDGKKPVEFYELDPIHDSCHEAQKLDLLRRQRELDARKGGAE